MRTRAWIKAEKNDMKAKHKVRFVITLLMAAVVLPDALIGAFGIFYELLGSVWL